MSSPTPIPLHGMTDVMVAEMCAAARQPAFRAAQILDWVYAKRVRSSETMLNLPKALRAWMDDAISWFEPQVVRCLGSADTTRKYLLRLEDGRLVESVLIPASPALYGEASDRLTLCVSSQVGCAYGCKFCASGLAGWTRNLAAQEIVAQIIAVERASGERISNLVFMGMGEPLANFENLMQAVRILNAPWGVGIGARRMTISTSGLAPQIRELATQALQVRLAISLHGASDAVRDRIMPVNRKYPLAELVEACEFYATTKKQTLTLEYILIEGVNDAAADAIDLARLARRLRAKVNLIPYNTVEGLEWRRPEEHVQEKFYESVRGNGVNVTLRREKGHDIAAACGQLRLQVETEDGLIFSGQSAACGGLGE